MSGNRGGCHAWLLPPVRYDSADWATPAHCEGLFDDDLTMRIMVEILMMALATSNNVPPMDPLMNSTGEYAFQTRDKVEKQIGRAHV